jgi:hypothetical protein
MIPSLLDNHPTSKYFELEMLVRYTDLKLVIRMATETAQGCQLQRLHLDIDVDYSDHESDDDSDNYSVEEEEDGNRDYNAFVKAFASNTTITLAYISDNILNSCDTKKLYFYGERNKAFHKISSNLIVGGIDRNDQCSKYEEEELHVDDSSGYNSGNDNSNSTAIPLGLWPHLLDAAYKQFQLLHLLSSQTVGLVLLSCRDERDISSRNSRN